MEVFSAAALGTLIWKVISVVKMLTGRDFTAAVTQGLTWAAGIITVLLAAQADVSEAITVWGTQTLGQLDGWSQVLVGLTLSSAASATYDFKKAVDNTDSAGEPPLGGGLASNHHGGT